MNDDDFEHLLEELQRKIEYEEEATYSKVVIREYRKPSNFGMIENPDTLGEVKGPCGDTMKISLRIEDRKIRDACFWTDGCGATIACGSMLTKMIKGEILEGVSAITSERLIDALEGLPKEHMHCSKLAVDTLQKAIKNYNKKKNSESPSL